MLGDPERDAGEDATPRAARDAGSDLDAAAVACPDVCPVTMPVCDEATGRCVACTDDAECTDPARADCEEATGRCRACVTHDQCAHLGGRCEMGVCTDARRARCEPCASDVDCADGLGCVEMTFAGVARSSGFCLSPALAGACPERPFTTLLRGRPTLSGGEARDWCAIDERLTSCEAVLDTIGMPAACASDDACGSPRLGRDGLCRAGMCTYPCDSHADCEPASDCIDDTTSSGGTGTGSFGGGPATSVDFCR